MNDEKDNDKNAKIEWTSHTPELIKDSLDEAIQLHVSENAVLAIEDYHSRIEMQIWAINGEFTFEIRASSWEPTIPKRVWKIEDIYLGIDDEKERETVINGLLKLIDRVKSHTVYN
jgi:hypothetical protein